MNRIRIIVGPFSSEPFATGLSRLLSQPDDFEVVHWAGEQVAEISLQAAGPSILILERTDQDVYLPLLEASDDVSVVLLDTVESTAFVGLDNPDWRQLVLIIRAVAGETALQTGGSVHDRVRLVAPRDLSMSGSSEAPSPITGPLRDWLDLTFARALLGMDDHAARTIPGWTVAPREALGLLGPEVSDTALADLDLRLAQLDSALIVGRNAMPSSIAEIATTFSLDADQLRLFCLVLAPEIDGRYCTAIGVLQDDLTRRRPGLTLLARLLDGGDLAIDLRQMLASPNGYGLRGLIVPEHPGTDALGAEIGYLPSQAVVAHVMFGTAAEAAAVLGATMVTGGGVQPTSAERYQADRLRALLGHGPERPLVNVRGNTGFLWLERVAAEVGYPLIRGDLGALPAGRPAIEVMADWTTLCAIHDAALLIIGVETLELQQRRQIGSSLPTMVDQLPLVVVDGEPADLVPPTVTVWRVGESRASTAERIERWTAAAESAGHDLTDDEARHLAETVRMDPGDIDVCISLCRDQLGDAIGNRSLVAAIQQTARELSRQQVPPAVRRVEAVFDWDDLIVPDSVKGALRTISDHVLYSGRVLEDWGFSLRIPYGQGVAALFSGPSGTGKTMAAQIIAGDLGVELLQVDLSKTISKYIGETEKNLDLVFDAAERVGAVLLFDEADALFGKRTEVKDAHDRHANVEVAYLLQRMEAFGGLAVLTSNLRQNIDQAFLRRLRFAVDFPLPTAAERQEIWQRSFPPSAPLADDLDIAFLARRLTLTGGSIQQAALHAAFAAASMDQPIGMEQVVGATRRELLKVGMLHAEKCLEDDAAA